MKQFLLLLTTAAVLALLVLGVVLRTHLSFAFASLSFDHPGTGSFVETSLPFTAGQLAEPIDLTVQYNAFIKPPSEVTVYLNGCVEKFEVNGHPYTALFGTECEGGMYRIPMGDSFETGNNIITARIKGLEDQPVIFHMKPSAGDPITLLTDISLVFLFSTATFLFTLALWGAAPILPVWFPLAAGTSLRYLYLVSTHYHVRAHDVSEHLAYVSHILKSGSLPDPTAHLAAHQPPLYYALSAGLTWGVKHISNSEEVLRAAIQLAGFGLSVLTLAAGIAIGSLVLSTAISNRGRFFFGLLLATCPTLIFASAQINNDILLMLIGMLTCLSLLKWWDNADQPHRWLLVCLLFSLGLLTKLNMLLMAPVIVICLLSHPQLSLSNKLNNLGAFLGIGTAITGWYFYLRGHVSVALFEASKIDSATQLTYAPDSFYSFSITSLFSSPFNDPLDVTGRRSQFWEYLFRSSFFGEYQFVNEFSMGATALLLSGLTVLTFALGMLLRSLWKRDYFGTPMLALFALPLIMQIIYCLQSPYAPHQDLRLNIFLLIPLFYYFSQATLPAKPTLGSLSSMAGALMCLFSTLLIVQIYLAPRVLFFVQ